MSYRQYDIDCESGTMKTIVREDIIEDVLPQTCDPKGPSLVLFRAANNYVKVRPSEVEIVERSMELV